MRRFWVMFMAGVLLSTMMVDDTEAAELPDQLKIGSDVLALNGSGYRKKSFLKLYTAGLYLKEKSRSANNIIEANEAMSIRIKVILLWVMRGGWSLFQEILNLQQFPMERIGYTRRKECTYNFIVF